MEIIKTNFVVPPIESFVGAVVISLAFTPYCLLILLQEGNEVNWERVTEVMENMDQSIISAGLVKSTNGAIASPFTFRGCDYAVSLILGLIELHTHKIFAPKVSSLGAPAHVEEKFTVVAYDII